MIDRIASRTVLVLVSALATGTYDFTGLTVFYFVVTDGGFEPVGMIFRR